MTVSELLEIGLPAWVDLNDDGVLDIDDIEAFLDGAVPDTGGPDILKESATSGDPEVLDAVSDEPLLVLCADHA